VFCFDLANLAIIGFHIGKKEYIKIASSSIKIEKMIRINEKIIDFKVKGDMSSIHHQMVLHTKTNDKK